MTIDTVRSEDVTTVAAAQAAIRRSALGERLLFVLAEAQPFANEARLSVLRRMADEFGIEIGLLTSDAAVRSCARKARVPVYDTVAQADQQWRYPKPELPLPPPERVRPMVIAPPRDAGLNLAAPTLVTTASGTLLAGRVQRKRPNVWLSALGYFLFAVIVGLVLVGLAVLLIPQATVTLAPERTRFVSSVELTGRVGIDASDYLNKTVPARAIQARVEGFAEIPTTGSEDAPAGRAGGVVTFINQTQREQLVREGVIVRTTTGNDVRFRVVTPVLVPAGVGQTATASIEAVEPGRAGNVPAFTINEIEGPLNLTLRVSNASGTGGGTAQNVATVTQADKDRLLGQLQADLQQQAYDQLAAGLRQGEYIAPESVRTFTLAETYDRFSGERSDTLGLQLQLLARGTAVDMKGAEGLAERSLRETIPSDHYILDETVAFGQPSFTRFSDDAATFTLTANAETLLPIGTGDVRALLAGLPLDQAALKLRESFQLAARPQVTLSPNWLNRLPYIPSRIKVHILRQPDGAEVTQP